MTDHLLEKSKQRISGAKTPPELKNYERLPEVERQIGEVWQLSEIQIAARLKITDYKEENFIRAETLACLLNFAHAENLPQIEGLIYERLFVICKNRIRKILRDRIFDDDFIEELARNVFAEVYQQIIDRKKKCYDYWEVRFYLPLKFIVQNHLRKHSSEYKPTELFSEKSDENEAQFEETLEAKENFARDFEIRETNRRILAAMPVDLRKIFILYHRDGETQKKIAETLGITDRMIRYKFVKIQEFLSRWRDFQENAK